MCGTLTPREICLQVMSEEIEEKRKKSVKEKAEIIYKRAHKYGRVCISPDYFQDKELVIEELFKMAEKTADVILAIGTFNCYVLDGELLGNKHCCEEFIYVYVTFGQYVDDVLEEIDKKYPEIHEEYDPLEDNPTKKGETNMKTKNPVMVRAGKISRITAQINALKRQYDTATAGVKSGITKQIKKLEASKSDC